MNIDEYAARWAVRLASEALSVEEQQQLERWLHADPRHRGALVRARAHWADLDRLAALHRPAGAPQAPTANWPRFSRRQWIGAAAAAATALGSGLTWLAQRSRPQRYVSGLGEVRRIPLADGSTVLLNTSSELVVNIDEQQRHLALIRGEALFEVAPDKARPFVVLTEAMAVRAVGTAFDVRLEANGLDVTVTEGTVELRHSSASGAQPQAQRLSINERAVVDRTRGVEVRSIAAAEAERQLAWRDGLLSFNNETLAAAAAEINRYNRRQVVIDGAELAAMPIVGRFRTTDIDDFARAAAAALNAQLVVDEGHLRLRPKGQRPGRCGGNVATMPE
jgi:transmembrane sensor